jgi:hypothetical protein
MGLQKNRFTYFGDRKINKFVCQSSSLHSSVFFTAPLTLRHLTSHSSLLHSSLHSSLFFTSFCAPFLFTRSCSLHFLLFVILLHILRHFTPHSSSFHSSLFITSLFTFVKNFVGNTSIIRSNKCILITIFYALSMHRSTLGLCVNSVIAVRIYSKLAYSSNVSTLLQFQPLEKPVY